MYSEQKLLKLYELANNLSLKLHISVSDIFVTSSKGGWRIEICGNGIKLWHRNFSLNRNKSRSISNSYHLQKKYMPNAEEALKYITAHDNVRFTTKENYIRIA